MVLVTGASSGIGLALAKALSQRPDTRAVISTRAASLPKLADAGIAENERLLIRPLDVTQEDQRSELVREIQSLWGGVDVLINNAGIAYRSVVEHMSPQEAVHQLSTNFLGPMELTRLVLPGMRQKRAGRIINISSVSGMMAMPTMGTYTASKFALEGASESLWYEVKPWNIYVTLVQPGFIRSASFRNVYLSIRAQEAVENDCAAYNHVYQRMGPFIERLMLRSRTTPEQIARLTLATLDQARPPLRIPATLDAKFFFLLRRLLPRKTYHALLYHSLPGIKEWGPEEEIEDVTRNEGR
ncbi:MAG: SDR family NAD(P)-dependent oxidoreductase [Deltaproteobacteria bacterium]|nr:SDR family NAD(P)-dependent oxidoreductase [Deltaproteobacteria bacterium]